MRSVRSPLSALRFVSPLLLLVIITALPACGGGEPTGPDPGGDGEGLVATVEVTPGVDTLRALDDSREFQAVARDADGDVVAGVDFQWATSAESVASVNADGVVTAVGNGSTDITATTSGVSGSAEVAVLQRVEAVAVTPTTSTLTTVGATQQFSAAATDANGNDVEGAQFVWASEDHAVATVDPDGVATGKGSGTSTITATAQDIPGHAEITVNQEIDRLAFREEPSSATAGDPIDPAVQVSVLDAAGNVVEDAEIALSLSLSDNPGGATLGGAKTVNAVNGVATFSALHVERAGTGYSLIATNSGTVTEATSAAFDITAGPAAQVSFTGQPSDGVAGAAINPAVEVQVQDEFGNRITSSTDPVSVALATNPGDGNLSGAVTVDAVSGVASFSDLSIEKAASGYVLETTSGTLDSELSTSFEVSAAPASRLAFTEGVAVHANSVVDTPVEVEVRDEFGNTVTTATNEVSMTLVDPAFGGDPFGGTLSGTLTRSAVDGIATFDDLSVDIVGTYALEASSTGLSTGSVTTFVVVEFIALSAGQAHTCGIAVTGDMHCWGRGDDGQLGNGATDLSFLSPRLVQGGHSWDAVSAGESHTCGVTGDGEVFCWGDASNGKLGNAESTGTFPLPQPIQSTESYHSVSAGNDHTCAITLAGDAFCWGSAVSGRLGNGATTGDFGTPQAVTTSDAYVDISVGASHSCALTGTGNAFCWGDAGSGRLGNGETTGEFPTPQPVSAPSGFTSQEYVGLDAGGGHTCAIGTGEDLVFCWGFGGDGRLGDGETTNNPIPDRVSGAQRFRSLASGGDHSCAVSDDGRTYCWGDNSEGQLGNGSTGDQSAPMLVSDLEPLPESAPGAAEVAAGEAHSCVISGTAGFCWGRGAFGRLGDGTSTLNEFFPVRVLLSQ